MHRLAILLLAVLAATGCDDEQSSPYLEWRPLLVGEMAAAEIDRPADLYKFLHQGVMGPAHSVPDAAQARRWLEREWNELPPEPVSGRPPLLVPLRPDGRLVRVDLMGLRDLTAFGAEVAAIDTLVAAFAVTAQTWVADPDLLAALWSAVATDSLLWRDRFTAADLAAFNSALDEAWPAVHHSKSYHDRRAPHYRVVDPRLLPVVWRESGGAP